MRLALDIAGWIVVAAGALYYLALAAWAWHATYVEIRHSWRSWR